MNAENSCRYFDSCSAPLCPKDASCLENGIWYAEEETCKRSEYVQFPWVKAQKKIARLNKRPEGYFNLAMLERGCVVKNGIAGLDPDREEKPQLEAWLRKHPPKCPVSEERRQALRKRIERLRGFRKGSFP